MCACVSERERKREKAGGEGGVEKRENERHEDILCKGGGVEREKEGGRERHTCLQIMHAHTCAHMHIHDCRQAQEAIGREKGMISRERKSERDTNR